FGHRRRGQGCRGPRGRLGPPAGAVGSPRLSGAGQVRDAGLAHDERGPRPSGDCDDGVSKMSFHGQSTSPMSGKSSPTGAETVAEEAVIDALRTAYAPEIPVNIYDLG